MTDQQGTRFYKPEEIAKILHVSRDAVMQLIKRRELYAIRFSSRTVRVTDGQLDWYQRSTATARPSTKSDRKERG